MQSLSVDAARADDATRAAYEAEWVGIRDAAAAGLAGGADERRARATALLALLSGGVSIARAVRRPEVSDAVAAAVRSAALEIVAPVRRAGGARQKTTARAQPPVVGGLALPDRVGAAERVRAVEDAWNARDAARVARAHTEGAFFRSRAEIARGREAIERLLERRWSRELDARRASEVFSLAEGRLAVRVACEWRDDSGNWFRGAGVELWELDESGMVRHHEGSTNDAPIDEGGRLFRWPPGPRPADHPGPSELSL